MNRPLNENRAILGGTDALVCPAPVTNVIASPPRADEAISSSPRHKEHLDSYGSIAYNLKGDGVNICPKLMKLQIALSPPRLGEPEELEKRSPSQKDRGLGGIPQSLNVIASGAKQSHRIPLYLQARGDCFVVLLYGRTPRNDINIPPRLGDTGG